MVDDVKNIAETAESKAAAAEALDRAKLARERREAEQRKKLEELRAHAAAAQAQRERREEERRRRQADQRANNDDRRHLVEERKRSIWEASISRREALLQREREREERLERTRAARSAPRPAFAFGSSTPRLLEPVDTAGFFWAARSTNPIDQMNFFESLAASTTNVMFASAPLTRRASALQLDADNDNKDEPDRNPAPAMWSSVARRRTDLVPTLPAPRGPGRAYSMTRLDRLPAQRPLHSTSPSLHQLPRQGASSASTPGSRPGSALSNCTAVVRRAAPRRPRPASIAGTGVNTPRGGGDAGPLAASLATTPSVSRDASSTNMAGGDAARRPPAATPRRPRPVSLIATRPVSATSTPGDGKPPLHRKPKLSKEQEKGKRGNSLSVSPGRGTVSPSPAASKEPSVDKEIANKKQPKPAADKSQVSATEVVQKLEALQIHGDINLDDKVNEHKEPIASKPESKEVIEQSKSEETLVDVRKPAEKPEIPQKPIILEKPEILKKKPEIPEKKPEIPEKKPDIQEEKPDIPEKKPEVPEKKPEIAEKKPDVPEKKPEVPEKLEKREEKKESAERPEESEMTASMTARRITTEGEAKAALAERRRKAREELEKQAELERQRLQREAEEEAERQRQEEERQRREEEEARELAQLQRKMEEEKLRKAIEAQQQLEREEAERKIREEAEKQARLKEEEEKRKALEEELRLKREEAEREEKERLARKQRVEAIMARTRLKKAEEDKKQQESPSANPLPNSAEGSQPAPAPSTEGTPTHQNNGNGKPESNNGNATADLLGLSAPSSATEPKSVPDVATVAAPPCEDAGSNPTSNNGNVTADLLGLSEQTNNEDKLEVQTTSNNKTDNAPTTNPPSLETNNGNVPHPAPANIGHISANFIQTERMSAEQQKLAENVSKFDDDFTTHNGHGHTHPLTLQNAI